MTPRQYNMPMQNAVRHGKEVQRIGVLTIVGVSGSFTIHDCGMYYNSFLLDPDDPDGKVPYRCFYIHLSRGVSEIPGGNQITLSPMGFQAECEAVARIVSERLHRYFALRPVTDSEKIVARSEVNEALDAVLETRAHAARTIPMDVLLLLGEVPSLSKVRVVILVILPYTGELLWQIYPRIEGRRNSNSLYDPKFKYVFLVYENTLGSAGDVK